MGGLVRTQYDSLYVCTYIHKVFVRFVRNILHMELTSYATCVEFCQKRPTTSVKRDLLVWHVFTVTQDMVCVWMRTRVWDCVLCQKRPTTSVKRDLLVCDIAFFVCASYVPWGVHKPWQKNNIFSIFLPWYVYTHGRTSAMAKKIECGLFVPTPWVEDQNVEHQAELTINNNVHTRIREDGCSCRVRAMYLPCTCPRTVEHARTHTYAHVHAYAYRQCYE